MIQRTPFRSYLPALSFLILLIVIVDPAATVTIPEPPSVREIEAMVTRPTGEGNAADYYLQAEALYRKTELHKPSEERLVLDDTSEVYSLVEKGLAIRHCTFPYSMTMKLPPYEQMIPMMALYRAAAVTWRKKGDAALEREDYDAARAWYSKAVNLGLQLNEEPGITIIQDMIAFTCMQEGVEGLGDLYIATGDGDNAAACARFLAHRTRYMDELPKFVNTILRSPDQKMPSLSESFKAVARLYPTISYAPIKVEIILSTGEILAFHRGDPETEHYCNMVLDHAIKEPDPRIRTIAEWAKKLEVKDLMAMINEEVGTVDTPLEARPDK